MPAPDESPLEALVARLPDFARDAFQHRVTAGDPAPRNAAELFEAVRGWAGSAAIAERRGGYSGGRGKLDWSDYVALQRQHIAIYHALADAFGAPAAAIADRFADYERAFPAPVRWMGDGYEPHVDDVAGRLVYSLPVDSGFVGRSFSFALRERDLAVLLADPWRRALLEGIAHTLLQHSMIRGSPEVTELDFAGIVAAVLHSTPEALRRYVAGVDRAHNISIEHYARAAMARRA